MSEARNGNGMRLNLKTVGGLVVIIGALTTGWLFLSSALYVDEVDAASHIDEFGDHVGEFNEHRVRAEAQGEAVRAMRAAQKDQRAMLRTIHENQIRIMERLRVQPVRGGRDR